MRVEVYEQRQHRAEMKSMVIRGCARQYAALGVVKCLSIASMADDGAGK